MKIYKYHQSIMEFRIQGEFQIEMPIDNSVKFLSVGLQYFGKMQIPVIWCEAPEEPLYGSTRVKFYSAFTGEDVPSGKYLGTVQYDNGIVCHIYKI